ncbi:Spt20 family-domain-containing protein [Dipodascopsis tothii]|uniref:Spt20 family-domain-containing protein n=1 Tax=Dipodascopsis tothii TaxID=44089 RepID=UPI0034CEE106
MASRPSSKTRPPGLQTPSGAGAGAGMTGAGTPTQIKKIKLTQKGHGSLPSERKKLAAAQAQAAAQAAAAAAAGPASPAPNSTTYGSSGLLGKSLFGLGPGEGGAGVAALGAGAKDVKISLTKERLQEHREYHYAETTEEILEKYKDEPPSVEFHIHPTHYRFGNQDAIIPKNSPFIKNFLDLVKLEQIPPPAVEVFRELGVRFYESCIILQILDHRKPVVAPSRHGSASAGASTPAPAGTVTATTGAAAAAAAAPTPATATPANKDGKNNVSQQALEPSTSRVLLRPTPLTLWSDLTYYSENVGGRFTDALALALESEFLATTQPRLDLSVPATEPVDDTLLPFLPASLLPRHLTGEVDANGCLHAPNINTTTKRRRPLSEDLPHHQGTEFEEMMLVMDERPPPGTGQFVRLGFIEQWRRRRERERAQRLANNGQQQPNTPAPTTSWTMGR